MLHEKHFWLQRPCDSPTIACCIFLYLRCGTQGKSDFGEIAFMGWEANWPNKTHVKLANIFHSFLHQHLVAQRSPRRLFVLNNTSHLISLKKTIKPKTNTHKTVCVQFDLLHQNSTFPGKCLSTNFISSAGMHPSSSLLNTRNVSYNQFELLRYIYRLVLGFT